MKKEMVTRQQESRRKWRLLGLGKQPSECGISGSCGISLVVVSRKEWHRTKGECCLVYSFFYSITKTVLARFES